jgi:uncharacterized protein (TIGR00159 family)
MIETIISGLQDFARNIRIVDILDVALISVVFYLILNWLLQSISRRTFIGFTILLVIYIIARLTGMYLTELLLQALFIVILIGLVVVFQSDIRRIVDRIGSWRVFDNQKALSHSNVATDTLTEAVSKMAENKIGALIAIRGKEEWERHIDGGIELNGKLSIPMLFSIFNPTAPGHDGAVLLKGDQIVRFGTHLPLSKNLTSNSGGTRHAAALGLSEHCDALVVVVSEERGTISIAQSGRLKKLDSSSDLKSILDSFWQQHYQSQEKTLIDWWRKRNLRTAVASVALASILWFSFAYQSETVYRSFSVPIEYTNLQSRNVVLQDSLPMEARVTLSGSEQAFRSLDPSALVISFNMTEENLNSDELIISQRNINLPNDLQLFDVTPRSLTIKARATSEIRLPIKIPTQGELPDDLELITLDSKTQSISILADQSADSLPDSITTEPIDLSTIEQSTEIKKELVIPSGCKLADGSPKEIAIAVKVQKKNQ